MKTIINKFILRFLSFSIGPFLASIIGFIIIPITTYYLNPMQFGKAAMFSLAITLLSLIIYFGMDQSFVREYNGSKNKKATFASSVFVPILFSLIVSLIFLLNYKTISKILFDEINLLAIIYFDLCILLATISRFSLLLIRMQENGKIYSIYIILNKIFYAVIVYVLMKKYDKSYMAVVKATFYSTLITTFLEYLFTIKYWNIIFNIDINLTKKMLKYGIPLVPATIMIWLFSSMDRIALRSLSTYEELGIYSAAYKIVNVVGIFQQSFSTFWIPTAYRWYENKVDNKRFENVINSLAFIMGMMFLIIVEFKDVLIGLLDTQYASAAICIPFLLLSPVLYTISESTSLGIAFSRKTVYNIIISLVSLLVNFFGNLFLIPSYGALGASISTGISYIMFFGLRTEISIKLWYKYRIKTLVIDVILVFIAAIINTIIKNSIINIAFMIIYVFVNAEIITNYIIYFKSNK